MTRQELVDAESMLFTRCIANIRLDFSLKMTPYNEFPNNDLYLE